MKTILTTFPFRGMAFLLLVGLSAIVSCTSPGFDGHEWRLIEIAGSAVAPLPGNEQPTLKFDTANNKATGFSGCNNFFSQYQLDDTSLKFGPVGATRRACAEAESAIEQIFLGVLDKTRAWQIKDNKLALLSGTEVLARFIVDKPNDTNPDLESLTFRSTVYTERSVTLTRGEFRTPAAPGSASAVVVRLTDKRAFATMDGKAMGAVVVVTSTGGTGSFYELALLAKRTDGWLNVDTILLGDRTKVQAVTIEDKLIVILMKAHAPNDPMCCPTLDVKKQFAISDNHLVAVTANPNNNPLPLTGTRWQWIQTRYSNDKLVTPPKPEKYTIQFMNEGQVSVKADCNMKGGTYTTNGKQLSITILNSTMAMCEPGSLEDEFVRNLSAGVIFFFNEGNLYIDMKYDSGTLKFASSP